jgi:RNA polymerase sigma-B factor
MAPLPHRLDDSEALVLRHRRLARHLAQRYVRGGESSEDLEQVACVGLVKAARRFDPQRGVAFTTFAVPTILGELRRFCRDTRWAVHVPRTIQEHVQALRRIEDAHRGMHGRGPSTAEAAALLGWCEEEVIEARLAAGGLSPRSLNVTAESPDGVVGEAIDSLGEDDAGFESAERRDELQRAFAHLSGPERRVLQLRGGGASTPEIARALGLSPSQTSRLAARALTRLRAVLNGDSPSDPRHDDAFVRLVDADPELFGGLGAKDLIRARHTAVAQRMSVDPGHWDGPVGDGLGLLIVSGAVLRIVAIDGQPRAELLGAGDVVRVVDGGGSGQARTTCQVVTSTELATLDGRVLETVCAWPSVVRALLSRADDRSNALAIQLAITDQRRVDDRLLSLFGALGNRWGRRTAVGVAIALPLTHDMVAMLVGAYRPTVTSALHRLSRAGRLRRDGEREWLLAAVEPARLTAVAA